MATLILDGLKTQTRRFSLKRPAKPGSLHYAQTKLYDPESRFAHLKILDVWEWNGVYITPEDALAEGFQYNAEKSDKELCGRFLEYYRLLNINAKRANERKHYAISFEVIETYNTKAEVVCGCGDHYHTYFNQLLCDTCLILAEIENA